MKEMRIAILPNEQKDDGLVHTRKLLALLGGRPWGPAAQPGGASIPASCGDARGRWHDD